MLSDCCCGSHSGDVDPFKTGGNSEPRGDQSKARCCQLHQTKRSRIRIACTIFKLKCVRAILRPLIKTHVWFVLRAQNKIDDDTINEGTANQNKANKENKNAKL